MLTRPEDQSGENFCFFVFIFLEGGVGNREIVRTSPYYTFPIVEELLWKELRILAYIIGK